MVSFVYLLITDIQLPAVCGRNIGLYNRRHYSDIIRPIIFINIIMIYEKHWSV